MKEIVELHGGQIAAKTEPRKEANLSSRCLPMCNNVEMSAPVCTFPGYTTQ
ncbi:hypothetical protein PO124_10445 [Bacillus licheniformis]|nr:hypothetical protein [Bacillus licheniformis]